MRWSNPPSSFSHTFYGRPFSIPIPPAVSSPRRTQERMPDRHLLRYTPGMMRPDGSSRGRGAEPLRYSQEQRCIAGGGVGANIPHKRYPMYQSYPHQDCEEPFISSRQFSARILAPVPSHQENQGRMPDRHQVERFFAGVHQEDLVDLVVMERPDRNRREAP